jgi:hypothetical protein
LALIDDVGAGPVGVDTALFIYFIDEDKRFLATIAPLFEAAFGIRSIGRQHNNSLLSCYRRSWRAL